MKSEKSYFKKILSNLFIYSLLIILFAFVVNAKPSSLLVDSRSNIDSTVLSNVELTSTHTTPTPPGQIDSVASDNDSLITNQVTGGTWLSSLWFVGGFFLLLLFFILKPSGLKNKNNVSSNDAKSNPFNDEDIRPVIDLEGIGPEYNESLLAMDIEDTKQLWEADTAIVAQRTGAPISVVKSWQNMAELSCVKDIGPQYSELLERSGVHSILQLKGYDANNLLELVREKEKSLKINIQGNSPGYDLVKNWIDQARKHKFSAS